MPLPPSPSFLHRCGPGIKLSAFASLSAAIMAISPYQIAWWWAMIVVLVALWAAGVSWRHWFSLLRRLTLLFVSLILFHGFFVPGHWIWQEIPSLTWEGVTEGAKQCVRLILLASLAWSLSVTSTPMQLVSIGFFNSLCHRFPFWRRGLALLAMTLHMSGRLLGSVGRIKQSLYLREVNNGVTTWVMAGNVLLLKIMQEVHTLEEALTVRGFDQLPLLVDISRHGMGWRDGVVVVLAFAFWLLPLG